ncbi:hypothetical protein HMPREF1043_1512 [Streptococcus anginosus subsp. whileyi CCUG 39159]|uniref:Uncharacterized protein n=1 Tax=Streptococcus anginosus subsp. whileyi CCUG 39159 TaxID=1095729 RepID=I0SC77_STRAP|nr:hypothetical protein SanJ4211_0034c [Streptococcus anginosus]EID20980.1 hypothetical protein HMPREF1043_1512 [Streptococcus anginosus subsp. whileyi CCUG 39159]
MHNFSFFKPALGCRGVVNFLACDATLFFSSFLKSRGKANIPSKKSS